MRVHQLFKHIKLLKLLLYTLKAPIMCQCLTNVNILICKLLKLIIIHIIDENSVFFFLVYIKEEEEKKITKNTKRCIFLVVYE